jgi:Seven in absentia protein family
MSFHKCLKCPTCSEFFTQPIYQCEFGHSICEKCCQLSNKCPTCKSLISKKLRNFQLEQQLLTIKCSCRFAGCQTIYTMNLRSNHERECEYNPSSHCLLQNCRWKGEKMNLLMHLSTKHNIPHYEISSNSAEYSSRLRPCSLPPSAGCVKLLHTFYSADSRKVTILTYIFMDSARNLFFPQFRTLGNKEIKYMLKIWNNESEINDHVIIVGKARTIDVSLEEEREKKLCIAMDLETIINKFAFSDKVEEGHRLLHYKLDLNV